MLHTIAHYAFLTASAFTFICAAILLLLLAVTIDWYAGTGVLIRHDLQQYKGPKGAALVWEVPATVAGLGAFWAAVAYGLHLL